MGTDTVRRRAVVKRIKGAFGGLEQHTKRGRPEDAHMLHGSSTIDLVNARK